MKDRRRELERQEWQKEAEKGGPHRLHLDENEEVPDCSPLVSAQIKAAILSRHGNLDATLDGTDFKLMSFLVREEIRFDQAKKLFFEKGSPGYETAPDSYPRPQNN